MTPVEFIEDIVIWTIDDIIGNIKKGRYDFLGKYKDFVNKFVAKFNLKLAEDDEIKKIKIKEKELSLIVRKEKVIRC